MEQIDVLDSEDFYNVMQTYRWAGFVRGGSREEDVVPAFEAVKQWIRANYGANRLPFRAGHWCLNCGADLSNQSPTAPAHQCLPKSY